MRGFTFIELMVVITISAILTAGGLAAYRGIGEKEGLKQAGLNFESNLKLTQHKALAGEKPVGCTGLLQAFRLSAGSDEQTYSVQAICSLSNSSPIVYTLGEGIKFQSLITTPIDFAVLRNGVNGAQTVILTTNSGSFSYQVMVETSGVIRGMPL